VLGKALDTINAMPAAGQPPTESKACTLELATAPRVRAADGRLWPLAPLDAAMLAWLALEGPTPRARLALLLWPDKDADAARNSLRQRLYQLRKQVGADLIEGSTTLSLAPGVEHDLGEADRVLGDLHAEFSGEFAHWLEQQRTRRRDRVRHSLVELAQMAEGVKDWDDALSHAKELLALEPLNEDAHRRLMRLHHLAGDRAEALLAFDRCEQVLKDEVGAKPSAQTLALLHSIEHTETAALPAALQMPASVLRPPRLIGRQAQWQMLGAAWQAGHGAIVLGEAGLGKTRLATDFARAHGRTLVAGARPGDARVVYASVSRLLRALPTAALDAIDDSSRRELARLLPELGKAAAVAAMATDTERTRLFNAVSSVLDGPALAIDGIVFDDLHFADDASIELLHYVSSSSSSRHWLVTARGAELTASGRALLDGFSARDPTVRIELPPLTLEQIEAFVASLDIVGLDAARLAPLLARHTGGNPLYLLETLKAWLAAEPGSVAGGTAPRLPASHSVTQLIAQRIGRLSMPAVQLARCAAVAAPDFSIELASQVLGLRTLELADPWAELEAAHVLRDGAFAHDLIYESALASVPLPVARRLHAEIAAYLDSHEGEPARVAAHWLEAGHDAQALAALQRAASQARAAMRKREEVEFLRRAADLAERLQRPAEAFECLSSVYDALMIADRTPLDEAFFARLDRLADNPDQRVRALIHRTDIAKSTGRYAEGAALAEAAAQMARSLGKPRQEVEALRAAAACAAWSGDPHRAVRMLRPALPWMLEHGADADQQSFFNDLGCCLNDADQPLEAQQYHRRALAGAIKLGRLDQASIACANLTYGLKCVGRLQAAFDNALEARRYALGFDEAQATTFALDLMCLALLRDLGRYAEALQAVEITLRSAGQDAAAAAVAHGHVAALWLHLGQPARAQQALATAHAQAVPPRRRARLAQLAGQLQRSLGQPAAGAFELAMAQAPLAGLTALQSMIALDHAHSLPADEALAACVQVMQRCDMLGLAGVALAARVRAALFAVHAQQPQRAAAYARQALDTPADVHPDDLYRAELWLNSALAFDAAGQTGEARAAAATGRHWVLQLATEQVPAEFRHGFLHRNPVNRELLALAARLGPG
jgi:DNA-binding SARP family transcriptional activator